MLRQWVVNRNEVKDLLISKFVHSPVEVRVSQQFLLDMKNTNHHEQSESTTTKDLPNIHFLSIRIQSTLLVKKVLDSLSAGQDDEGLGSQDQAVDGSILVCPLAEL